MWILVKHNVKDYQTFRKAFFENLTLVPNNGSQGGKILRSTSYPNEIWVMVNWENMERFQQFAAQAPQDSLERGGVIGQPEGWFLEEVEEFSNSLPKTY